MTVRLIKHNVWQKHLEKNGRMWMPSSSEIDKIHDEVIEEYGRYQFTKAVDEMRAISELDSDVELPVFEHEP